MGAASFLQSSFLAGEWSKSAQGALHDPRYKMAMNVCLNGLPLEPGVWTRRPGFRHAGTTRGGNAGRVLPWDFQEDAPYSMEFTDGFLRFRRSTILVPSNDARTVTDISTANPAEVTVDADHGWSDLDEIYFTFSDATTPLLQNRVFRATVTDTDKFTLTDAVTGDNIDGSTLGWAAPSIPVTVSRIYELTTKYIGGSWADLRVVQARTSGVLLHHDLAPAILQVLSAPTDTESATFSLDDVIFHDGPYDDPISNGVVVTPSAVSGIINLVLSAPAYDSSKVYNVGDFVTDSSVTYRSLLDQNLNNTPASSATFWETVSIGTTLSDDGFQPHDIGRMIRLFSEPPDWDTATDYVANDVVKYNNAYWTALKSMTGATPTTGQVNPNQPGINADTWAPSAGVNIARWTWGKITGFANSIAQGTGTEITNTTVNAGAAFDGVASKSSGNCESTHRSSFCILNVGKHFGGGAEQIATVSIVPSTDRGFAICDGARIQWIQARLMASQTAPDLTSLSISTTGTVLADTGAIDNTAAPMSLTSSDQSTAWNYVWIELSARGNKANDVKPYIAQATFFSPVTDTTNAVSVQVLGDPLLYSAAVRTWRLGIFGGSFGYPTCGCWHEGRLWFGGALPNRIDSSVANGIDHKTVNMAPTESDGTVTDANGVSYVFNASDQNPVFWMQSEEQGILCGTQAGEWIVQATNNNNILTPTSIQAHRRTTIGCANIEPVRATLTNVIVQKFKRKVHEFFADVFSGKFTSPDLTVNAKHLTQSFIEELAFQHEISPIVWMRRGDGALLGCSYKRESLFSSQGPTYSAMHRHELGSGRVVESLRVASNFDGTLDSPIIVTNDTDTDIRHVEVMADIFEEGSDIADAFFVDDGIAASSYTTGAITGGTGLIANGFWHLNGETVSVFAGSLDLGDFAVSNGTIEVPFNDTFTQDFVDGFAGAMKIVAGFTYTSDGQILKPDTNPESGARNGPGFAKARRLHKYAADLIDTQGIYFGTDFSRLHKAQLRTVPGGGTALPATSLYTGIHKDTLSDDPQGFASRLCWRITRPYPATLAGIGGFLQTQDE